MGRDQTEQRLRALSLMREELVRRQDSQAHRLGTIQTTGGVLVAASAITATLVSADQGATGWMAAAVAASLGAAAFGVFSLYPRAIEEIKPSELRARLLVPDGVEAALWLNDRLIEHIARRESALHERFRFIRLGLVSLSGSILFAMAPVAIELVGG